jgi:hypothetical protein
MEQTSAQQRHGACDADPEDLQHARKGGSKSKDECPREPPEQAKTPTNQEPDPPRGKPPEVLRGPREPDPAAGRKTTPQNPEPDPPRDKPRKGAPRTRPRH